MSEKITLTPEELEFLFLQCARFGAFQSWMMHKSKTEYSSQDEFFEKNRLHHLVKEYLSSDLCQEIEDFLNHIHDRKSVWDFTENLNKTINEFI